MAGSIGWRLLIVFSLILVVCASRAQDAQIDRRALPYPKLGVLSENRETPVQLPIGLEFPPGSVVLHPVPRMLKFSGIIFSGQVISVRHQNSAPGQQAAPTVITFHVQHGVRGVAAGQNLTIREWSGLWDRGERYRIGQRVFLFLYPPSRLGLTSPVGGPFGRLAMDFRERILLRPEIAEAFARDLAIDRTGTVPYSDFSRALLHVNYQK